ncbi:CrcB family protein [Cohnella endophytica]|uniref:Fluoride-specific ion channel FluC n=1 Tax=Cohnella endophytica TaxID=2419778 RepID=A0A494XXV3_9BACL|nr:CrcB family protein [Cohnella endophytica]RKP55332.1 CrcB family protein [Cohnella endophytica]
MGKGQVGMNGIWTACLVGIGGSIGTLLRYGVSRSAAAKLKPGYYGTLTVNLAGSFAMGMLIGTHLEQTDFAAYAFSGIGILGGLTTYSTLNVQKADLSAKGAKGTLRTYIAATYIGGFGLTAIGVALGNLMNT